MSVKFKPFTLLDIEGFLPMPEIFTWHDMARLVEHSRHRLSEIYTVYDEQGPMGYVGGTLLWQGRADGWTILGEDIKRKPKEFSVLVGEIINSYIEKNSIRRMESHVREGYEAGVKWIERFGFVREGLMKQYLPCGSNAYLYARYN